MKTVSFIYFLLITLFFLLACNDDDELTTAETQLNKITANPWKIVSVTRGDEDVSIFYEGFIITFEGNLNEKKYNVDGTFTTENGGQTFSSQGPWKFDDSDVGSKIMLDGRLTDYLFGETNDTTTLQLSFQFEGDENARLSAVTGDYVFELIESE